MTLIAKVTDLKDTIDNQDKNYYSQVQELDKFRIKNNKLIEHNEELVK